MKYVPTIALLACSLISSSFTDPPSLVSENKIIMECPEVTCSATTSFTGQISNTGQSNGGPFPVTGVSLYIDFAAGMSISDLIISKGEVTMVTDEFMGISIGDMDAAEVIDYSFNVSPIASGNFLNLELVQNEFNPGNNKFECELDYIPCADLKLTKSTSKPIYMIDERFNFDFKVENLGPDDAENVVVYDDFFSPFELMDYPDYCTLNSSNNALTCEIGTLATGESHSFSVETRVEFPYENTNTASVISETHDPVLSNNESSVDVSIVDSSIDLEVNISSDKNRINVGEDINYTISVKNLGGGDATDVTVTNFLPSFANGIGIRDIHLHIIAPPQGCDVSRDEIVCKIPSLASGEEKIFLYQASATASRNLSNYVEAFATSPEEDFLGNNVSTNNVHVRGDYSSTDGNEDEDFASDPVSVYTGEFFFSEFEDLIQFGVMNIVFDRYYGSRLHNDQYTPGTLGKNWSHNYDWRLHKDEEGYIEIYNYKGKVFVFENRDDEWHIINHPTKYKLSEDGVEYHFGDLENQSIYSFNAAGQLKMVSNLNGLGVSLTYEEALLKAIEDNFGRKITLSYNSDGLLSSISNGVQSSEYDYTDGALTSCTLGNGATTTYSYDDIHGFLTGRNDYGGSVPILTQKYGSSGVVLEQTDILGNQYLFSYDSLKTTFTDPAGGQTIYEFDNFGTIKKITSPRGAPFLVNEGNNGSRITEDEQGNTFDIHYDDLSGQPSLLDFYDDEFEITYVPIVVKGITFELPSAIIYPDGSSKTFSYDAVGNLIEQTSLGGDKLTFNYSDHLLLSELLVNDVPFYHYEYDAKGNITKISDSKGAEVLLTYDELGRRLSVSTADQVVEQHEYNASHLPTQIKKGEDELTIDYTSFDKVASVTYPDGSAISFLYDAMRRQTGWVDQLVDSVIYTLDQNGNIVEIIDRTNSSYAIAYDTNNNPISLDRNGLQFHFSYDNLDRLDKYILPGGRNVEMDLRNDGLINSVSINGKQSGDFHYNENNAFTGITYPSGRSQSIIRNSAGAVHSIEMSDVVKATYEAIGLEKYTKITDPNGGEWEITYGPDLLPASTRNPLGEQVNYEYDDLKQLTIIKGTDMSTNISYNSTGQPINFTYADGESIDLEYDEMGRLTRGKSLEVGYDEKGNIQECNGLQMTHDDEGRITEIQYDETFTVTYEYNVLGQCNRVLDSYGSTYDIEYHDNQLPSKILRSNSTSTEYEYNEFNQIINIQESGPNFSKEIAISYDEDGRVMQVTRTNSDYPILETEDNLYQYNQAHQLADTEYDEAGNEQSSSNAEFTWNGAGELTKISTNDGESILKYDAYGNRTAKEKGESVKSYIYNYGLDIAQVSVIKEGDQKTYYISAPDGFLLYALDSASSSVSHMHFDERDNTSFLTDGSGELLSSFSYTPYGVESTSENNGAFTFLGRWGVLWDSDSRLFQMHKRFYDPLRKRFISRDHDFNRMDPRLINPYVYSPQDPINYIDPLGNTPSEAQDDNLQLEPLGALGFSLFAGTTFATGLPVGLEAPKLPSGRGSLGKGILDFLAGSPGAPESLSRSGRLLDNARTAAQTGQFAGQHGLNTIKNTQTQIALDNANKASKWKTRGKGLSAAGNVATVANVGVTLNKSRKKINDVENRAVENINSNVNTFSVQTNNLIKLHKQGKISKAVFNRRFRELLENFNYSTSSSNIIFLTELSLEGTDGLLKGLEAMLPNPTSFSLSDGVYGLFGYSSNSFRQ